MPSTPLIACSSGVGHGRLDRLRVGAGVERDHADLRRRQLRILRDRHRRDRDRAREDDDERADGREDRPADEGVDEHGARLEPASARACTGAPSPSFWMPDTMTLLARPSGRLRRRSRRRRPRRPDRPLPRDEALALRLGDEAEVLAADARDGDDRHGQRRLRCSRRSARATNCWTRSAGGASCSSALDQHRLCRLVHARRDERDRVGRDDLAVGVEQLHRQPEPQIAARARAAPGCRPRAPALSSIVVITVDGRDAVADADGMSPTTPGLRRVDAVVLRAPRGSSRTCASSAASCASAVAQRFCACSNSCRLIAPAVDQRLQPLRPAAASTATSASAPGALRLGAAHGGLLLVRIDLDERRAGAHAVARLHEDPRDEPVDLRLDRRRAQRPHRRDELRGAARSASAASVDELDAGRRRRRLRRAGRAAAAVARAAASDCSDGRGAERRASETA